MCRKTEQSDKDKTRITTDRPGEGLNWVKNNRRVQHIEGGVGTVLYTC